MSLKQQDRAPAGAPGGIAARGYTHIAVRPVSPAIGADVEGVDLSRPLTAVVGEEIEQALGQHGVVFFRDQELTPEQHIAAARRFGEININRFFRAVEGHPEIAQVSKDPNQSSNIGGTWHTDHSYDVAPAKGSLLYAIEVPEVGGDTVFSSMYAAYDALSDGLKATLGRLRAVHSSRHVFGYESRGLAEGDLKGRILNPELATQDAVHPVVVTHPTSGRKALFVNPNFTIGIEGWAAAESKALLDFLYAHAVRPEFTCRFRWKPGSLAFWDNRATWHLALNDYPGARRLLHRITIEGTTLN